MIYVVIDTNVLVSALLNINSNPGTVLLSVFKGETIPLLNPEILAEYRDVLARKKFKFPAGRHFYAALGFYIPGFVVHRIGNVACNSSLPACIYRHTNYTYQQHQPMDKVCQSDHRSCWLRGNGILLFSGH